LEKIHYAANNGTSVNDIYIHIITPVMHELGRLWHLNKISVGHEHYCTAVAQMVMAQLFPWIFDGNAKKRRLVSACVAGELHEIGARMVSDLFEMNGWDTVFLGADVPVESVIDSVIQHDASVLAISVTLAAHLSAVSEMILQVRENRDCAKVKILVGGAAFSIDKTLWQRLGADGWAEDIDNAITIVNRWKP
jgi:methanogenic corrinoid protein MtbC1